MASFEVALSDKLKANELALPDGFNQPRFVQNVIALTDSNEDLKKWIMNHDDGAKQVLKGAMRGAFLGLDFLSKEAYLIPYGNSLNFQIDYRGAQKLAKKYSIRPISEIYAKVVREGDEFQEKIIDGRQSVDFTPKPFNNGEIIGVFGVCVFKDGGMIVETMNMDEIKTVKSKSKSASSNSSPWKLYPQEMAKKSVIHRLCKKIELDFDNSDQMQAFNSEDDYEQNIEQQVADDIAENANTEDFVVATDVTGDKDELPFG